MNYSTEQILTTKITKATKVSDICAFKLRALRVLRGANYLRLLHCGAAALGLCSEYSVTVMPDEAEK
jgi:hypothetical protein